MTLLISRLFYVNQHGSGLSLHRCHTRSLHYLWMVSTHTMEYIDAATSSILSPHVLPVTDLQKMLQHIADTLPPTLHLPISPEDTLHFYRYLCTHVLMENKQFLLLIDIPIQDRAHQITVHQVFTLDIPYGNYSACYDINTRYFGVTKDVMMGVELSATQFQICQQANGQFCHISTDLQKMLQHIADTLPPTLHLPISPEDTLHFYRYLHTHVLMENKQFLLLIDIPIQDRAHQITVHQVFTLDIPYGNYSACYDINTRYFGVTKDVMMGVELSATQFQICQQANGQFCHISAPFQLLANPPTCIAALYTKSKAGIASKCSLQLCKTTTTALPTQITPDIWILTTPATAPINTGTLICPEKPMETIAIWQPIHILKLPTACSATSSHFYLPPRYETPILNVSVSLDKANLQMINISALHFHIWQHLGNNWSDMQLQHLTTIPSIPVHKVYQHHLNSTMPLVPFNTEPSGNRDSLWSVFTHLGIYISALGLIIPVGIGLFCCYFFWCRPARLACQPLQPGNM